MMLKRGTITSEVIGGAAEQASKGTAWPHKEPTDPPRCRCLHLLHLRAVEVSLLLQVIVIGDPGHLKTGEELTLTALELGAEPGEGRFGSGEFIAETPHLEAQLLLRHGVGVSKDVRPLGTIPDLRFDRFNHERPPPGG
jgi:hypothetical protein